MTDTIYSTGTADFTSGSPNVVGHSSIWTSLFEGDLMLGPDGAWYEIITITDDTHIVLDRNYGGTTVSAHAYQIFKQSIARDSVNSLSSKLSTISGLLRSAFNFTSTDQFFTLDKAAAANNAGIIFNSATVNKLRMGLFGGTTLAFQFLSGLTWTDALTITAAGVVAFPQGLAAQSFSGLLTANAGLTIAGSALTMSGDISAVAWTTSGVKIKQATATLTDTSSSGTVGAAYTNKFGGHTIAASSATTFTNYYGSYFTNPSAGANVTLTNLWALGADSAKIVGGMTVGGTLTATLAAGAQTGITALGTLTGLTVNGATSVTSASFGLSGDISGAGIFGTSGIRYKNSAVTLTDTSSSGTVATNYTSLWGGNTLAASSATTITNAYGGYFNAPTAGSNVTLTNAWGLGADSAKIAGALSVGGAATLSAALTYGGVTLSNSVTGTGSMVLSAGPTFTGTAAHAAASFSGAVTMTAGTSSSSIGSGTLVVTGGAGISGALWIGGLANVAGKLTTVASASGGAGLNLPHGAAPTSPVDGDIWTTSAGGLFARINGATVGPFGTGSSLTVGTTAVGSGTSGRVLYDNGGTLGEYAISGTGSVAMTASPTFTGTAAHAAASFSGAVTMTAGTASTTPGTGTLVVTGGVGVSGALNVGGASNTAGVASFTNSTLASSSSAGAVVVTGGIAIMCTNEAASATNGGSFTTAGGLAAAKRIIAGGYVASNTAFILGVNYVEWQDAYGNSVIGGSNALPPFDGGVLAFNNTLVGQGTGSAITTGADNFVMGYQSCQFMTTGSANISVGKWSLRLNVADGNNVAIGVAALYAVGSATGTGYNIGVGAGAGGSITTGGYNVVIGVSTSGITTGSYNTVIGGQLSSLSASLANAVVLADGQGNIRYDYNATTSSKHTLTGGVVRMTGYGAGTATFDASGNISSSSDARLKTFVRKFTRSISDLRGIGPASVFDWSDDSPYQGREAGWMLAAGEGMDLAIPEAVGRTPDGYLTLHERPILATCVNAIIDIDDELSRLRARVSELERQLPKAA